MNDQVRTSLPSGPISETVTAIRSAFCWVVYSHYEQRLLVGDAALEDEVGGTSSGWAACAPDR